MENSIIGLPPLPPFLAKIMEFDIADPPPSNMEFDIICFIDDFPKS